MLTAEKQKILINPHTGDKLIILSDTISHPEKTLVMEAIYQQASEFAPEHYHPYQQERFEVRSGTLRTKINGTTRDYISGEIFVIPSGTPHAMYNPTKEEVHFSWQVTPALRSETFFTSLYTTLNTTNVNKKGKPSLKDTMYFLSDFQQEFILTTIPKFIQKAIFSFIAIVCKIVSQIVTYRSF